ncbi:atypical chemokine receptor 3-like [Siniperca chuatsi]|uniref:atypical chemokine receptor 3-like n=1 Tax=Siniperca chuatsi TaxID=119488 RepID=UPI001CE1165B|nr:atypical chemokine receptor 3-like [Siniperca chuatsi]
METRTSSSGVVPQLKPPPPPPGAFLLLFLNCRHRGARSLCRGNWTEPASGPGPSREEAAEPDRTVLCEVDLAVMSLSANDLTELMELWEELNLTAADHHNLSHVETLLCSGAVSHAALLHVLSVLYVFIFLAGLAGNVLVVWVNLRADWNRYETHLYVLNLSVADLCVVATLPVWVTSLLQGGRWPFGEAVCKLTHLVFSVNLFSSIFFLTCMSVDRYLSVTLFANAPDSRRKKVVRRLICILVWLLALAASVPDTYFLQAVKSSRHDGAVCQPVYPSANPRDWMVGVQLSFFVLGFAIPFPVIAVFYLLLAAAIPPGSDQERRISRRIILTYIVVFLVCWLPFHAALLLDTLALLNVLPFSCRLENFLDVALHLTQCFSLVHCCINPVLYNFLNRNYRYDLMKAFIFKYSTKTGLARLIDGSHASETEYSAVAMDSSVPNASGLNASPSCS